MTKKRKLAKHALEQPHMFSQGELAYFQLWLKERKARIAVKKAPEPAEVRSEPADS